jgi:hypothetical protein
MNMARQLHNTVKETLNHELKTEFRAYFETSFAHELSKDPVLSPSVGKISDTIMALIRSNESSLINALENSSHAENDLFNDKVYGRLHVKNGMKLTGENIINLFLEILSSEESPLAQVLLVHGFFIHRLYDHCNNVEKKDTIKQKIFHHDVFSERQRTKNPNVRNNLKPGTINNRALANLVRVPYVTHGSPKDQFTLDENSSFIQDLKQHHLPLASSVSGHTGSLLLGALLYGRLNKTELQEYLLAAFCIFTLARAHTFHEVMIVGNIIGLPFSYEDYDTCIPDSIRHSPSYHRVGQMFQQFLQNESKEGKNKQLSQVHHEGNLLSLN